MMRRGGGGGRGRGGRRWNRGGRGGWGRRGGGWSGGGRNNGSQQDYSVIQEIGSPSDDSVSIAVEGCCHGALDIIYDQLKAHEEKSGRKIDLLLCCGDFQSLRSAADFQSFAVPLKYQKLGDFQNYYTGGKVAPIPTIFIGGNHEASQSLSELYYGGWVAPNIYYMGAAGVVSFRGIRIGGISGIYKSHDYQRSRFEVPPFDKGTMRSIYHYRNIEVYRLKCLSQKLDIMLSHDWPQGIEQYGNTQDLIRRKPFFEQEIASNTLGSPPLIELLREIKPKYWFSAHLHVKFTAKINHRATPSSIPAPLVPSQVIRSKKESSEETSEETTQFVAPETSTVCVASPPDLTDMMTQFLSLDKCLPRRQYLTVVHRPAPSNSSKIEYDIEWLAILRKTHALSASTQKHYVHPPSEVQHASDQDIDWVRERFQNVLTIPEDFECTVIPEAAGTRNYIEPLPRMGNPQTDKLLERLALEHLPNISIPYEGPFKVGPCVAPPAQDENEIDLDDDDEIMAPVAAARDENEIDLDDDHENEIALGDDDDADEQATMESKKPRIGD